MQQGRDQAFREPRGGGMACRWVGDRGSPPADVPHDYRKDLAGNDGLGWTRLFTVSRCQPVFKQFDRRAVH